MCHSPVPCHAHIIRHKTNTTQAQDNFSFVYDIFARPQPHLPQLYKSIAAHISCALLMPILCHTAHRQAHRPAVPILHATRYPTTTPPPCLTKLSPNTANTPAASYDRTAQQTAETQARTPPTCYIYIVPIMCFSCVYVVPRHTVSFTATEQIRRRPYILCLSCVYHVLTLCLSCVVFSRQSDIPKILHMTVRPLPYPCPI